MLLPRQEKLKMFCDKLHSLLDHCLVGHAYCAEWPVLLLAMRELAVSFLWVPMALTPRLSTVFYSEFCQIQVKTFQVLETRTLHWKWYGCAGGLVEKNDHINSNTCRSTLQNCKMYRSTEYFITERDFTLLCSSSVSCLIWTSDRATLFPLGKLRFTMRTVACNGSVQCAAHHWGPCRTVGYLQMWKSPNFCRVHWRVLEVSELLCLGDAREHICKAVCALDKWESLCAACSRHVGEPLDDPVRGSGCSRHQCSKFS